MSLATTWHDLAVTIAFFRYGNPQLEAFGVRLLNQVAAMFRSDLDPPDLVVAPIGPDFHYDSYAPLFLSRRGRGPLQIVWDTNLLIDYFEHGQALWEVGLPEELPDYADELEALQFIIAMWVIRDIRFHILPRVLIDAKRPVGGVAPGREGQRPRPVRSRATTRR
jgi:hypothetical protein